jgi:hypothetical protein
MNGAVKESMLKKLRQILALARDSGATPAERQAASDMLNRLMDKHGISSKALEDAELTFISLAYKNSFEKQLAMQVLGKFGIESYYRVNPITLKKQPGRIWVQCMTHKKAAIERYYAQMRRSLSKTLDTGLSAFIQVNNIFPPDEQIEDKEYTPDELEQIREILRMAAAMRSTQILEELPAGLDRRD